MINVSIWKNLEKEYVAIIQDELDNITFPKEELPLVIKMLQDIQNDTE